MGARQDNMMPSDFMVITAADGIVGPFAEGFAYSSMTILEDGTLFTILEICGRELSELHRNLIGGGSCLRGEVTPGAFGRIQLSSGAVMLHKA